MNATLLGNVSIILTHVTYLTKNGESFPHKFSVVRINEFATEFEIR